MSGTKSQRNLARKDKGNNVTDSLIQHKINGSVYEIYINRPEKFNALTDAMYAALTEQLHLAERDENINVIFIRSSGPNFCAGNDLKDFLENEFNLKSHVIQFLLALARLSKPLIVAINGAAVGIGTTMLLHSDIVYCSEDSKLSMPFIKLGLTPEGGSSQLLAAKCGPAKANDWLLTGRNIPAEEALSSGLVSHCCVDASSTWEEASACAQNLSKSSKDALIASKKLLKGEQIDSVISLMEKEALVFAERLQSAEAKAAFSAFLNK